MAEHHRLGVVERAVIESLDAIGARPDRYHRKSANAVAHMEAEWGISPRYAYDGLATLAQDWRLHVRLVDGHGNFGSADTHDEPSGPRYTEARLSLAGALTLAGERGDGPLMPVVLINGTLHFDGYAPPFAPERVVDALIALVNDPQLSDTEIEARIGPPTSPTGCEITCDCGALAAGEPTEMMMTARMRTEDDGDQLLIVIDNLPLGIGAHDAGQALADRVSNRQIPLRAMRNESSGLGTRLVCVFRAGADVEAGALDVASTWGVTTRRIVQLPAPLAQLVRELAVGDPDELCAALEKLRVT